ncbi:hypothetical protein ENBRE01_0197 [Enteropsectra breve]|nr:hypothetical protein ENBRE01_0197 [Enteropsectra breve]
MKAFFVSCNMNKEDKALKEFQSKAELNATNFPIIEIGPSTNFEKELEFELAMLRSSKSFLKFEEHKSFVIVKSTGDILPSQIVKQFRNLNYEFKHVQRIVPLDYFGSFDEDKIKKYVMNTKFSGSFKIAYEGRLCPEGTKERIFQAVIPMVNSPVNLKNPDFVILVQAFKKHIGITITENDPKNFNFMETF